MRRIIDGFDKMGIKCWFTSHIKKATRTDLNGYEYDIVDTTLSGKCRTVINGFVDMISFVSVEREYETKELPNGEETTIVVGEERTIRFRGDYGLTCGSRLEHIVESIPFDGAKFVEAIAEAAYKAHGGDPEDVKRKAELAREIKETTLIAKEYMMKIMKNYGESKQEILETLKNMNLDIKVGITKEDWGKLKPVLKDIETKWEEQADSGEQG